MDQGTDGCRTFHGVGQPDVQREHGTFTGTTDEHQPQSQRQHCPSFHQHHRFGRKGVSPHIVAVNEDTDEEAQVGKTCHDECFLGGGDGSRLRIVEADKQVGRNAHQLPEQVHLENVRGYYQTQHGHGEERQESVVTLKTALALHVAERINVNHQADRTDDNQHYHRDGVEQDTHVDTEPLGERQPTEVVRHQCLIRAVG